jgi:hypothetical protein
LGDYRNSHEVRIVEMKNFMSEVSYQEKIIMEIKHSYVWERISKWNVQGCMQGCLIMKHVCI